MSWQARSRGCDAAAEAGLLAKAEAAAKAGVGELPAAAAAASGVGVGVGGIAAVGATSNGVLYALHTHEAGGR